MKRYIVLYAVLVMLVVSSCGNSTNQNTEAPAENTVIVRDSVAPDGTRIQINDQGVSIESKDGNKTNSVNVSKDSASIEISSPK